MDSEWYSRFIDERPGLCFLSVYCWALRLLSGLSRVGCLWARRVALAHGIERAFVLACRPLCAPCWISSATSLPESCSWSLRWSVTTCSLLAFQVPFSSRPDDPWSSPVVAFRLLWPEGIGVSTRSYPSRCWWVAWDTLWDHPICSGWGCSHSCHSFALPCMSVAFQLPRRCVCPFLDWLVCWDKFATRFATPVPSCWFDTGRWWCVRLFGSRALGPLREAMALRWLRCCELLCLWLYWFDDWMSFRIGRKWKSSTEDHSLFRWYCGRRWTGFGHSSTFALGVELARTTGHSLEDYVESVDDKHVQPGLCIGVDDVDFAQYCSLEAVTPFSSCRTSPEDDLSVSGLDSWLWTQHVAKAWASGFAGRTYVLFPFSFCCTLSPLPVWDLCL